LRETGGKGKEDAAMNRYAVENVLFYSGLAGVSFAFWGGVVLLFVYMAP
jgi:hypothetical protein